MDVHSGEQRLHQPVFRSIGLISFLKSHFGYSLDYIPLINTQGAIVLGMVYNFLPFMVLPIYTVLIKLDRKLVEAAQDLARRPIWCSAASSSR